MESHPIYFQANRRWLMSWSKASSLFLLSPFLLSSAVPLVILQTKPITPESIYSFAHTFTFVLPVIHVHNAVWREKNKAHWYIGSHFEALCALWALCASITKSLSEGKVPIILKSCEIEIAPLSKDLTIEITPCWLSVKVKDAVQTAPWLSYCGKQILANLLRLFGFYAHVAK